MRTSGLGELQRWMQAVVTHPEGVTAGADSPQARQVLDRSIAEVVLPSPRLTPEERIAIYANMYFDRLVEVLEDELPALGALLGEEQRDRLLRAYLVRHPSCHWNLNELGARFPAFLAGPPPALGQGDTASFALELARLERGIQDVFDAPESPTLEAGSLFAVSAEERGDVRLRLAPALLLFAFEHAVHAWYQAFKDGETPPEVRREDTWLLLHRRNGTVWRRPLTRVEHAILESLQHGDTLGDALAAAAACPGGDPERLGSSLEGWFRDWTGLGLFAGLER